MKVFEELFEVAKKLDVAATLSDSEELAKPLQALAEAAHEVGRAFSGSWLGYQSRVYYQGLVPPPPGANFSQEWGLDDVSYVGLGSRGEWREYQFDQVVTVIRQRAGNPDLTPAKNAAEQAASAFDAQKSEIISILHEAIEERPDSFLSKLKNDIDQLAPLSLMGVAERWRPKGQIMTRDTLAMGQGAQIPPHVHVGAEVASLRQTFGICKAAAEIARKAASTLLNEKAGAMLPPIVWERTCS